MKNHATKPKAGIILTVIGVLIGLVSLCLLVLVCWGFLKSIQSIDSFLLSGTDFASIPLSFGEITYTNYVDSFTLLKAPRGDGTDAYLFEMLGNSILYATGCAAVHTLVPCVVGYLTSRYKVWFNKVVMFIIYFTLVFQVYGAMPAKILMMERLNLMDTWLGIFIMHASFVGGGYLFYFATFNRQSKEYAEAARIDGATHFQVMLQVAFPLARIILMVQFVSSFITYWNNYQTPMVYLSSHPTASYGAFLLRDATNSYNDYPIFKTAGFMIILAPIFLLFMVMKKYLLGDVTAGGVKE